LLHRAVEGPFADDRTSVFPTSCCCWRGACCDCGGLCRWGGRRRGRLPGAAHCRPRGATRRSFAGVGPLPCSGGQVSVRASAGGLPLLGAHARLSAGVARRTPTHCGSASWASSGRCPSTAVCGFPSVWCVCRGVDCGLRECVLFIGTLYSNLYTAVETPAEAT
jgi:hypothetical protein